METSGQYCKYRQLDNGIHELVFLEGSPRAIDEMFGHLEKFLLNPPPGEPVRLVIIVAAGQRIPLTYSLRRTRDWLVRVRRYPPTYIAMVQSFESRMSIILNFVKAIRTHHVGMRWFQGEHYDEAVRWLLEQ